MAVDSPQQNVLAAIIDEHYIEEPKLAQLLSAPPAKLKIDGKEITIKRTSYAVDPTSGKPFARPTTIYDAANELVKQGKFAKHPIPILCHREHLTPVAVCRFCVVECGSKNPDGSTWFPARLAPACHRQVENNMVVKTAN
ncbi:MAG TPA: hypothetical protein VKD72_10725, partial [Gemmataceae bacterium]|nr:hypothetical protein [Gemmataceae bacterium]